LLQNTYYSIKKYDFGDVKYFMIHIHNVYGDVIMNTRFKTIEAAIAYSMERELKNNPYL